MQTSSLPAPLSGIVPPMVTPLTADGELDAVGLQRLVEHILQGGVHGLFVLGTTGEGPLLSGRLQRDLIDRVCDLVAGRAPVLVGVTDTSLAESILLARHAHAAGASAAVYAPPCYFPVSQADLLRCIEQLAIQSPLPVVMYNMPALTKASFQADTVRRMASDPRVIGFKDSSGDLEQFEAMRDASASRPDWAMMTGPELLLKQSLEMGGTGGVCGGANLFPRLFVDLYKAVVEGNHEQAEELQLVVERLDALYRLSADGGTGCIQGLKAGLEEISICGRTMAAPHAALPTSRQAEVQAVISDVNEAMAAGV